MENCSLRCCIKLLSGMRRSSRLIILTSGVDVKVGEKGDMMGLRTRGSVYALGRRQYGVRVS